MYVMNSDTTMIEGTYVRASAYEVVYEPIYETSYSVSFVFIEEEEDQESLAMCNDDEPGATIH